MMEDSKKLQALIELAWENGYTANKVSWRRHTPIDTMDLVDVLLMGSIEQTAASVVIEGDLENTILFDHDFIKALCRAKYGENYENPVGIIADGSNLGCLSWSNYYLARVAVHASDKRIAYLYDTFMGEEK